MPSVNKVIIVGHIGKDPDVRHFERSSVANFSVATSKRYKDRNGTVQTVTEWHYITLFNKLAEIAAAHLIKGALVYIEGELKTEKYTDKEGIERHVTKIIGRQIQMLNSKEKEKPQTNQGVQSEFIDDDIPF